MTRFRLRLDCDNCGDHDGRETRPPARPPAQFPCDLFYAGRLQDGVAGTARPAPAGFPWPRPDWPVAFVPVPHGREESEGSSKSNRAEAEAVAAAVAGLLAAGVPPAAVGVITPYAAQVRACSNREGERDG
jgi:superfamily I DNA and/or RNA helicase